MANAKSILPYSFSLKLSSVAASLDIKKDANLINQIHELASAYFASECTQQVVIYDVRYANNDLCIDLTIGKSLYTA